MNLGKREQRLILSVAFFITVGSLHWFVFKPKADQFKEVFDEMSDVKKTAESMTILPSKKVLDDFIELNKRLQSFYDSRATSLSITMNPAFKVPLFDEMEYVGLEGLDPAAQEPVKVQQFEAMLADKLGQQTELVIGEIRELWEFDKRRGNNRAGRTELTFLGETGWNLPTDLPATARGGALRDILTELGDMVEIVKGIDNEALKDRIQASYEEQLRKLGVDNELYRNTQPGGIAWHGEYVPIIHKMCYAIMIEDELGEDRSFMSPPATREFIYEMLGIKLPLRSMVDVKGNDIGINEMYFLYEQLRFLIGLLDQAVQDKILEVSTVRFEDASYLEDYGGGGLPFANTDLKTPIPTPVPYNDFVLPKRIIFDPNNPTAPPLEDDPNKGAEASPPGMADLGYVIPTVITFKSDNAKGHIYLYNVTSRYRLSEIDELSIASDRQNRNADIIWFQARLLGVPYLFTKEEMDATAPKPKSIAGQGGEGPAAKGGGGDEGPIMYDKEGERLGPGGGDSGGGGK